jgi:rSAM-partnered protein
VLDDRREGHQRVVGVLKRSAVTADRIEQYLSGGTRDESPAGVPSPWESVGASRAVRTLRPTMTDETDRTPDTDGRPAWTVVDAPRADDQPEWELFVHESPTDPLRHAGSVTAPTADLAHEQATLLFPDATTLWCCPAAEVTRFTRRSLGADYLEDDDDAEDAGEHA